MLTVFIGFGGGTLAEDLPIEFTTLPNGDLALLWPSVPDGLYRVEVSDDLDQWALLRFSVTGEAGSPSGINVGNPAQAAQRFWRVHAFEPPEGALLYDSLENGAAGWRNQVVAGGTRWDLAQPEGLGPEAPWSGFHLWGTAAGGPYFAGELAVLDSPLVDLRGVSGAELSFWHWIDLEQDRDFGAVDLVNDAGEVLWPNLGLFTGVDQEWRRVTLALPPVVLGQLVRIRFRFQSDAMQEEAQSGWHFDEISVIER